MFERLKQVAIRAISFTSIVAKFWEVELLSVLTDVKQRQLSRIIQKLQHCVDKLKI